MATVATHEVAPHAMSTSSNAEELMQKLDELLEQYLNTLDQYQKAREQLSNHLSSGYMALAQANFNNSAGRRYGQDYYDERMQAQRIMSISGVEGLSEDVVQYRCTKVMDLDATTSSKEEDSSEQVDEAKHKSRDPLRWFGVLVPQPLRTAQASFTTAIEASIPDISNLQQTLRGLEIEIGRTRKSIKKLAKV